MDLSSIKHLSTYPLKGNAVSNLIHGKKEWNTILATHKAWQKKRSPRTGFHLHTTLKNLGTF